MIEIPDFVSDLIQIYGIPVVVRRSDHSSQVEYDLQTCMKSEIILRYHFGENEWKAHMRYDEVFLVEDIDDIFRLARHAMHGRDFMASYWHDAFIQYGGHE